MGSFSIWHWLIVLIIILLVFGTSKLRNFGRDLGSGIKGFKEGLKEGQDEAQTDAAGDTKKVTNQSVSNAEAVDVTAKEKNTTK